MMIPQQAFVKGKKAEVLKQNKLKSLQHITLPLIHIFNLLAEIYINTFPLITFETKVYIKKPRLNNCLKLSALKP